MSNATAVKETKSSTKVGHNGSLINADEISRLGKRKGAQVIIQTLLDIQEDMLQNIETDTKAKANGKDLRIHLKKTEIGRKMKQASEDRREAQKNYKILASERQGVLRLCKKLGFDVHKLTENLKPVGEG